MSRTVIMLLAGVALTACVSRQQYETVRRDVDVLTMQRDQLAQKYERLYEENSRLTGEVRRLGQNAADAAWVAEQKERMSALLAQLESSGGQLPEGVTIRNTALGTIVEVQGEILFASGKADVTPDGLATLQSLVSTLVQDGRMMRVDGHTDTDPIRHSGWDTNLDLSVARSLAVAKALIAAGAPASRISVGGFGEYQPRVEGSDQAAKQANRRVEILLLNN